LFRKHVPQKRTSSKFTNPWANTNIRKLANKKRKAYKAKKGNNLEDWQRYKKIKAFTQKTTRQAHNYVRDIIGPHLQDNSKQFYGYIKSKKQESAGVAALRDQQGYLQ
jgi:hypothetical protein